MKRIFLSFTIAASAIMLHSCFSQKTVYLEMFSPEESGLNLVKITDEANGSVVAGTSSSLTGGSNYVNSIWGYNKDHNFKWSCIPNLVVSPDGFKLAYVANINKQNNIMVRNTNSQGISTQRTFRNVSGGFCWGEDGRLYFADNNAPNYYINSVDAEQGNVMLQHTSGNVDDSFPAISKDGKVLFFTRWIAAYGPSIWALNKETGTLSSCARGFNACPIPDNNNAFYCVRNSTAGRSEIWYVDYVNGKESVIVSDVNHSFTNPTLSPDGSWLLLVGNSTSSISKKENTDIYAVRTDGTHLTQLTYHPENDLCPAWSKDGRSIFFISSRANKERSYNIWQMTFNLK